MQNDEQMLRRRQRGYLGRIWYLIGRRQLTSRVVSGCAGKSSEPLHATDSAFEGYFSDMFPLGTSVLGCQCRRSSCR